MKTYYVYGFGSIKAKGPREAAVALFKRKAPKSVPALLRIRTSGEPDVYWDSRAALRRAGLLIIA